MSKNTNFTGHHISYHLLKPQEGFEEVVVRIGRRYINTEFLFMLPTLRPKASRLFGLCNHSALSSESASQPKM